MTNKSPKRRNNILLAAFAGLSTLAFIRPAAAQYSSGQDGHAHDANNRVGSGGYNGSRAAVPYGQSGRPYNGLINNSIPNRATLGALGIGQVRDPQYGTAFGTPPSSLNGGYTINNSNGISLISPSSVTAENTPAGYIQGRISSESRFLSGALNSEAYGILNYSLDQTGTLNIAPVYGIHNPTNGIDNFYNPNATATDRFGVDNLTSILRMRKELRDTTSANPNLVQEYPANAQQPTGLNQPLNQALNQPLNQPLNAPTDSAVPNRVGGNETLLPQGNAANGYGRPSLIPAAQQSPLLLDLQKRMESTPVGKALADARLSAQQPPLPQVRTPQGQGVRPAPVKVRSLAEGIKAKGLHDLLAGAEDLIRQGQYDQASHNYNQAQQVAVNNPLPVLGRAQAELAGEYYARAEMDLRTAYRLDPSLLLMQFDLESLLPKGRVDHLRKDLQDLAQKDPKSARPWLLLAYLDYNTNHADLAENDLNEADQRSSARDVTLRQMRQFWVLPSNQKPGAATPRPIAPVPAPAPVNPQTPATRPAPAAPLPPLNK